MANEQFHHLKFERFFTSSEFRNPKVGRSDFELIPRRRQAQADSVRTQINQAVSDFQEMARRRNEEHYDEDIIYLEFESEPGYFLKTDSFDNGHGYYKINYSKTSRKLVGEEEKEVQKIGVTISKKGVTKFLEKVDQYSRYDTKGGRPQNENLVANISSVRAATLECFWTEPTEPFPGADDLVWWEVWLRNDELDSGGKRHENDWVSSRLIEAGLNVGDRRILFPEHTILMVKATVNQLSKTLLYTDKLAELRKPKETAAFFFENREYEKREWISELQGRIVDNTNSDSVLVCVLDSGVNRGHPLIAPFLPEQNMFTIKPDWGTADSYEGGHGTQMAGNALFGDLTGLLENSDSIQLYHKLESSKIYNPADPNKQDLYGALTIDAASQPVVVNPYNNRIYCMTITSDNYDHNGEPSSWSSAVDQISVGEEGGFNKHSLFLVSAGNTTILDNDTYPKKNENEIIEDPAQAFNALTVGAYTEKDYIDPNEEPNSYCVAKKGGLSPFSRTGINIDRAWANKPDMVFEGGNLGVDQQSKIVDPDSLKLLSVGNDPQRRLFSDNYATSGATALGSKFAAELFAEYPDYWPETIRGLMVHSAEWSDEMKEGQPFENVNSKQRLLGMYGYGIPDLEKARYSARDRLTLIAERQIKPFTREDNSDPKINEYHLYELPWPEDALNNLFDEELRVKVTLSYFIEPNPGKREYSQSYSYQSAGLRFKRSKPNESKEEFAQRVNRLTRPENYERSYAEKWQLGPDVRDKGSIHSDWCISTGPELASSNLIAVFPVSGWWKTRKKLKRYEHQMRYSLIVSIDSPSTDIDVDLYTPVKTTIETQVSV